MTTVGLLRASHAARGRLRRARWRTRLLLAFLLVGLVPAAVVGVHALGTSREALANELRLRGLSEAEELSARLETRLGGLERDMLFLAASAAWQPPRPEGSGPPAPGDLFASFMQAKPYYVELRLVARDGRELVRARPSGEGVHVTTGRGEDALGGEDLDAARALAPGQVHLSTVRFERQRGMLRPTLRLVTPVRAAGEAGFVVADVSAGPLLALLWRTDLAGDALPLPTFLLDERGLVIYPLHAAGVGPRAIGDLAPALREAVEDPASSGWVLTDQELFAWARVHYGQRPPWTVVLARPATAVQAAQSSLAGVTGLVLGGALLSAAALALVLARALSRPLSALTFASARLAEGQLGARTGLGHAPGELGALAAAFDAMAAALERREVELRRARDELARQAERLRAINRVGRAILDASSERETADAVLRDLGVPGGRGLAAVLRADGSATVEVVACRLDGGALGPGARRLPAEAPVDALGADVDAGAPRRCNGVPGACAWAEQLSGRQFGSCLLLPLPRDAARGALLLASDDPGLESGETLDVLREVSDWLAVALEQARLREAVRRHTDDLEARVAGRTAELRDTTARLEAFAYAVAHDLRAPLRHIEGFSHVLLEDHGPALGDTGRAQARALLEAGRRLGALVEDLLIYTRIGTEAPRLGPVSWDAVWRAARDRLGGEIAARAAVVEVQEPLPPVAADGRLLLTVAIHVLENALLYVPPGAAPRVHVSAERRGERVVLAVDDNGIGIPEEHRERVFRVFERLERREEGRTGMGLAIVKLAVERMGGTVRIEPRPGGGGSRFVVELSAPADGDVARAGQEAPGPGQA